MSFGGTSPTELGSQGGHLENGGRIIWVGGEGKRERKGKTYVMPQLKAKYF
jgi:hypothetical protein